MPCPHQTGVRGATRRHTMYHHTPSPRKPLFHPFHLDCHVVDGVLDGVVVLGLEGGEQAQREHVVRLDAVQRRGGRVVGDALLGLWVGQGLENLAPACGEGLGWMSARQIGGWYVL